MGDYTEHWEGFNQIPEQGVPQADGMEICEREGRYVGVSPSGGINGEGGITGGGYLRLPPPEKSCTVHCNQSYYGTVSGGREASGVTGDQEVVGAGRIVPGRDVDSGSGGGTGGGRGGYGKYIKGDGQIISWEDTVANLVSGMETNYPITYGMVL